MAIEDIVEFEKRRVEVIAGMDPRVIRGISDEEATELIVTFPEYAAKFKVKEGVGTGFEHARKHADEFGALDAFKRALNYVLSSAIRLKSRGTEMYLARLDPEAERFMLAFTVEDPVLGSEVMVTGYTAIAEPGPKDITKTFESMVLSGDVIMFAAPEGEARDRMIELYTNRDMAVVVRYSPKDSRCFIDADVMPRDGWERTKSGLIVPSKSNCRKYIREIDEESKVIDLRKMVA
ncbi:hypothetical protein JW707_02930 [Candidatus Woesearchaeota archaeon]|nr:hypothetical protein [Candidatus Woesearchaeota archaeon]